MRRWRPFAVAALLVRAAAAESRTLPEAVELVLPTCAPELFDPAGLVSFATVELRAAGVSSVGVADPPGVSSPRIVVACDASVTQVGLDVVRPGASDHRTLDLSDVPRELRARTIAIAMVELLRSGSGRSDVPNAGTPAMVESTAPTLPPALPAPPPQQDVAVAREGDRKAPARSGHMTGHIEAAAAVFDFPDRGTALVGPIAAFALDVGRLRASAGALFTFGQVEAATGVAETRWASIRSPKKKRTGSEAMAIWQ